MYLRPLPIFFKNAQLVLGKNLYICTHATIPSKLTSSDDSIITACAVFPSFVPTKELWGGIPLRKLSEMQNLQSVFDISHAASLQNYPL